MMTPFPQPRSLRVSTRAVLEPGGAVDSEPRRQVRDQAQADVRPPWAAGAGGSRTQDWPRLVRSPTAGHRPLFPLGLLGNLTPHPDCVQNGPVETASDGGTSNAAGPVAPPRRQLAVYVDLENVIWCYYEAVFGVARKDADRRKGAYEDRLAHVDFPAALDRLRRDQGPISFVRVFGIPANPVQRAYLEILERYGAEIVPITATYSGKNSADIFMVIAAMDDLIGPPQAAAGCDTVVLFTGDTDFRPLVERVQKIERDGRPMRVMGVAARAGMAAGLKQSLDEHCYIDVPARHPDDLGGMVHEYAVGAVYAALDSCPKRAPFVPHSWARRQIQQRIPSFTPHTLGYGSWDDFYRSIDGIVVTEGPKGKCLARRGTQPLNAGKPSAEKSPTEPPARHPAPTGADARVRSALATLRECGVGYVVHAQFADICRQLHPDALAVDWVGWASESGAPLQPGAISTLWGENPFCEVDDVLRAGLSAKPTSVVAVLEAVAAGADPACGLYLTSTRPSWAELSADEAAREAQSRANSILRRLPNGAIVPARAAAALLGDHDDTALAADIVRLLTPPASPPGSPTATEPDRAGRASLPDDKG